MKMIACIVYAIILAYTMYAILFIKYIPKSNVFVTIILLREKLDYDNTIILVTRNGNIFSISLRVSSSTFVSRLRQIVKAPVNFGMLWPSLFFLLFPFTQKWKVLRNC